MTDLRIENNSEPYYPSDIFKEEDVLEISDLDKIRIQYRKNNDHRWASISHIGCEGQVSITNAKEYKILHCGRCYFRTIFPKNIETVEQLIKYYDELNPEDPIENRADILDLDRRNERE